MKWTKPKLYDLSDLKQNVAQGACAVGGFFGGTSCTLGTLADACPAGNFIGDTACTAGSAPT
jgi:uncharacterized membrane protein YjfL (UPF0719 family)